MATGSKLSTLVTKVFNSMKIRLWKRTTSCLPEDGAEVLIKYHHLREAYRKPGDRMSVKEATLEGDAFHFKNEPGHIKVDSVPYWMPK